MTIAHARSHQREEVAQRYWEGMDKSMPAKLALMAGLMLLEDGATVVDAGCGSGAAAFHLAKLNPNVTVIGVDLDAAAVAACSDRHRLPNLTFRQGDVAKPLPFKADAILSSSTHHHVFAFGSPAYEAQNVVAAIAAHATSLNDGGILAIRDFVIPDNPLQDVILSLPSEGKVKGDIQKINEATLLERFALTARPLDAKAGPGFPLEELTPHDGKRRFRLSLQNATEFLLRKDYRRDWEAELHEQYGYFTATDFVQAMRTAGLGDIRVVPVHNHWIINNRWKGKVTLANEAGDPIAWPATNILVTGRKLAAGAVAIRWKLATKPRGYLKTSSWKGAHTNSIWTVAERPQQAIEVIPYAIAHGGLKVLARDGHPRPLATVADPLHPGRAIEPIAFADDNLTPHEALVRAGIPEDLIAGSAEPLLTYLPSAGGIAELARSYAIKLKSLPTAWKAPVPAGFSRGAVIRSFDAKDILLAAQAGSLDEGRLEIGVAALMKKLGVKPEPWTGEEINLSEIDATSPQMTPYRRRLLENSNASRLDQVPDAFTRVDDDTEAGWMAIRRGRFQDLDKDGNVLGSTDEIEWAEPRSGLPVSASILPLLKHKNGRIYVGLETRLLPSAQILAGNALMHCVPAWRLQTKFPNVQMAKINLALATKVMPRHLIPLGGSYFSSLGVTTERVYPFAADLTKAAICYSHLIPLDQILESPEHFLDGHLLISAMRAAEALSMF